MKTAALLVAGGTGQRASEGSHLPKQYALLGGKSVIARSLATFLGHPEIACVQSVIHTDHTELYRKATSSLTGVTLPEPVFGGPTRQASVLAGLETLEGKGITHVLIHDAARPFVSSQIIDAVLKALQTFDGALAAIPVADTLKRANPDDSTVLDTQDRTGLWQAQTPQGFRLDVLLSAHRSAVHQGLSFTDDAALFEWAGIPVALVMGHPSNSKITTAEDLKMAQQAHEQMEPRTGTGFDVHRFTEGDHVWLCGVKVAHSQSLDGHSDADVGLHALTDALFGALGDGDIGSHFPPSDPQWKGAASHVFLEKARACVAERGGRISNVDVTLICEAPKVGPHREAMRQAIAGILKVPPGRVGVKATTSERLGFTGRGEGIAAMASATILLPALTE